MSLPWRGSIFTSWLTGHNTRQARFELADVLPSMDFKSTALNHSAIAAYNKPFHIMLGMILDNRVTTWYTFANLTLTRHTSSSMTDIVLASRANWRCLDEALGERFSWCRWWHLQYRRAHTDGSADESRHRGNPDSSVVMAAGLFSFLDLFINIFQKAHPVLKIEFISKIKPFIQTLI